MIKSLPNLEHDLGIDNNGIDSYMSLYNILFLEEEQFSASLHKDVNNLHLDTTEKSVPITNLSEDDVITSVDEN